MKRKNCIAGLAGLIGFLILLQFVLPSGMAQTQDELRIGRPVFSQRIGRTLPEPIAGEEIRLGVLDLHPSFASFVDYDDNIRLARIDDKEDVIFTQIPALNVGMNLGNHRVEAGYGMEISKFAKEQEEDVISHLAHGLMELNFNDLSFKVEDNFEKTVNRLFSETAARDHYFVNSLDVLGRYDRPRWASELGWNHTTVDHKTESFESFDYEDDFLSFLGGYKIFPNTLFLVETDVGMVNFHRKINSADQTYWQILTGLRGQPTNLMELTAKIGFQERQLSDVPGVGPQTDFDGIVSDVDFYFRPDTEQTFRLGYLRTVKVSTFADNSWYRQDRIFTTYRRRFGGKWIVTPEFSWQLNDYPEAATISGANKRRDDHFWQAGIEIRYQIQAWLSIGATYMFRARDSNFDSFDYENNRFVFDISFAK